MSGKNHESQAIKQKRGFSKTNMEKLGINKKNQDTWFSIFGLLIPAFFWKQTLCKYILNQHSFFEVTIR